MNTIELDFALDDVQAEGQPISCESMLKEITDRGLTYVILKENGPAGGNHLLQLQGSKENIEKYMREAYCVHDLADLNMYLTSVK